MKNRIKQTKKKKRKSSESQGIYGLNANKSSIRKIHRGSDLSGSVK